MFTLTAPLGSTFDLSESITSWQFEVIPSFEFNTLQNNQLIKKVDLGPTKDKYYSNINLTMSFADFQLFVNWYSMYGKGQIISVNTNLDLFFPNIYDNNSCVIVDFKDVGFLDNIFSRTKIISLRLYSPTLQSYTLSPIIPPVFYRGLWDQKYNYSSKINVVQNGLSYQFTEYSNDSSKWTVSFNYLTRDEANDLLAWILSIRTSYISIWNNELNTNSNNQSYGKYNIESFSFTNNKTYYSLTMQMVQFVLRPSFVG